MTLSLQTFSYHFLLPLSLSREWRDSLTNRAVECSRLEVNVDVWQRWRWWNLVPHRKTFRALELSVGGVWVSIRLISDFLFFFRTQRGLFSCFSSLTNHSFPPFILSLAYKDNWWMHIQKGREIEHLIIHTQRHLLSLSLSTDTFCNLSLLSRHIGSCCWCPWSLQKEKVKTTDKTRIELCYTPGVGVSPTDERLVSLSIVCESLSLIPGGNLIIQEYLQN